MRINRDTVVTSLFAIVCVALGGAFFAAQAETMQVISGSTPGCDSASNAPVTQIVLHGIRFRAGGATLDRGSLPVLNYAVTVIRRQPDAVVYIAGQAAAAASDDHGADIDRLRADAVASYLEREGVAPGRIAVLESGSGPAGADLLAGQPGAGPVIELKLASASRNGCKGCS